MKSCFFSVATLLMALLLIVACGGDDEPKSGLSGTVKVDGSSTMFPITEAMAEEFQLMYRDVRVTVGISGTGGGFKKFCLGETDISDASRPIKPSEVENCSSHGVEFIELPVAFDGLSVMVNPKNDWVDYLTVEELKKIWEPGSAIEKWSEVRAGWPDEKIVLVGADTDSGSFDYFTQAIMGEEGASRPDYTASANDNVLVQAIASERNALGYLGFAYYVENPNRLKLVPVDGGDGAVTPSEETISNGNYQPLRRPLFIYVSKGAVVDKPEVAQFVNFYLDDENILLVRDAGYVALPANIYALIRKRFKEQVTGSMFVGGSQVGITIEELLEGER